MTENAPDWSAILKAYHFSDMRIEEICKLHNISSGTIYKRIRQMGWEKRSDRKARLAPHIFRHRLAAILDIKLTEIEGNLSDAKQADLAAIANLMKIYEKLCATEQGPPETTELTSQDVEDLRNRILAQIEKITS